MSPTEPSIPQPLTPTPIDWPVELLETVLRDRWQLLAARYPVIYLFGAGQHTQWLLSVITNTRGPKIAAILDDAATPGMRLNGYPVIPPSTTTAEAVDAVVLSTDDPTGALAQRGTLWAGPRAPVNLYEGMVPGPYRKQRLILSPPQVAPPPVTAPLPPEIHQLRLRLPPGMQRLFRIILPLLHPALAKALRALYHTADAIADPFTRDSTLRGLQYVRDVFYPPSHRFIRTADIANTGLRFNLNLCEIESGNLFFGRDFEDIETDAVRALLAPGDCVIDGGSHMGLFSLIAAQQVGPSGSIHAFEANPDVHAMFLTNLKLNQVRTVKANLLALAEQPGEMTFCINEDTSLSSLTDTGRGRVARRITVHATNLDEYVRTHSLPPVKFLKLDLEGFEWDALRGATELIARNPEMAILCELAPRNLIPRKIHTADVLAWVHGQGLAVWEIDLAQRRLVRLEGNMPGCGHRNYFFARQNSHMAGLLDILTARIPEGVKS